MKYTDYVMESVCSALDSMVECGELTESQADQIYDIALEKYMTEARRLDKEIINKANKIEKLENDIINAPDMPDSEKARLLNKLKSKVVLPAYVDYKYNNDHARLTVSRFKKLQEEMNKPSNGRTRVLDTDVKDKLHNAKTNLITKDKKVHDLTPAKEKEPGKYLNIAKNRKLEKEIDNL